MKATLRHGAINLRTATARRYVVVRTPANDPAYAYVEYRTDVLERAWEHLRTRGMAQRLIFDTTTGKLV